MTEQTLPHADRRKRQLPQINPVYFVLAAL
ncbi:MAG: hypothetical protein JWQ65_1993, partial [Devosia sp.]|nr:hypothetical protein [Devosia sp.]